MSPASPPLPNHPAAGPLFKALREAGDAILDHARQPNPSRKPDGTRVTAADFASEAVIIAALAAHFPQDGYLSEEGAERPAQPGGGQWYIDPLDGTAAFLEGLAHCGPTLCRVRDGKVDLGAFYLPRTGTFWFAAAGGGAWRDGERLRPSDADPGDPDGVLYLPSHAHRAGPLRWAGRTRALGSIAAHLAQVASGDAAAAVIPSWQIWDVGAGLLLLSEAKRQAHTLSGAPFDPMLHRQQPFLAGAPSVLAPLRHAILDLNVPSL